MSKAHRITPRVVCCAIPIARAQGKVLVITSRKRKDKWLFPKGGWEPIDPTLQDAASREAIEEAGVRGDITRFIVTIPGTTAIYHFFELDVSSLDQDWLESKERVREWVDYGEAVRRLSWKPELVHALMMSTVAPRQR